MSALSQLKILYHLTLSPIRGETHQQRLESFYADQAEHYDESRKKMLHGRDELFAELPDGGAWVDLGAGTGRNAERFGDRLGRFNNVTLVDLSESLLDMANRRIVDREWNNVSTLLADVTQLELPDESADLVTFTYSLTMIPDWYAAIEQAHRLLRPGGTIGVVDFYVARRYPVEAHRRQSFFTRNFWPFWFGMDNVHPSPDHLPYLARRFETTSLAENYGKLPWIPFLRAPHYRFIGRKPK